MGLRERKNEEEREGERQSRRETRGNSGRVGVGIVKLGGIVGEWG